MDNSVSLFIFMFDFQGDHENKGGYTFGKRSNYAQGWHHC